MQKLLNVETNQYEIKLENFEGPLDLLCTLVDNNKMDIYNINIAEITNQYIEYINQMEKLNLDIASEFLVMATALLYIKSKGLLPKLEEAEEELTEEMLLHRIIEYKKYKEISKKLFEQYLIYSKRYYKFQEKIELPKQYLVTEYNKEDISLKYIEVLERNKKRQSELELTRITDNLERISVSESVTMYSKIKEIYKQLLSKPKFIFSSVFSPETHKKIEVITAFNGILELDKRNKIKVEQKKLFGDIVVEKIVKKQL